MKSFFNCQKNLERWFFFVFNEHHLQLSNCKHLHQTWHLFKIYFFRWSINSSQHLRSRLFNFNDRVLQFVLCKYCQYISFFFKKILSCWSIKTCFFLLTHDKNRHRMFYFLKAFLFHKCMNLTHLYLFAFINQHSQFSRHKFHHQMCVFNRSIVLWSTKIHFKRMIFCEC